VDVLESITDLWLKQVQMAEQVKERKFGKTAAQLWGFTGKSYREIYMQDVAQQDAFPHQENGPEWKVRVAKSAEFVDTMLPYVHAKVPRRLVSSRRPDIPDALLPLLGEEAIALKEGEMVGGFLQEWWLNWLASDAGYGLYRESRTALPEGLVKGAGVMWHEMFEGPYGLIPGSFADTIDGLLIDPDTVHLRDAGYIVRKRTEQCWRVADRFGIPARQLRGTDKSHQHRAIESYGGESTDDRKPNEGHDVCVWYEIFSRVGAGHRLLSSSEEQSKHLAALEGLGPYVYLAVTPSLKFPLNLPRHALDDETESEVQRRLQWPIPFHQDINNPWPMSMLEFLPSHDKPWPRSPLEAGLPFQIFLDHLHSHLFSRIRATCRDIIVCSSALEDNLKSALQSGLDQAIAVVDGKPGDDLARLIEVIQFPPVNTDLWTIGQLAERGFERATGMTPLLGGHEPAKQVRSAEEAARRDQRAGSRPDDYADGVEQWQSAVAAKEGQATRLLVPPPTWLFGEPEPELTPEGPGEYTGPLSVQWQRHVNTPSPAVACTEASYMVEAGSGKRKNKQQESQEIQQVTQTFLPATLDMAAAGNVDPWNEMIEMLDKHYETISLDGLKMAPPPPQEGPTPEEEQMILEQQKAQLDMQIKAQTAEMDMEIKALKAELDMQAASQKAAVAVQNEMSKADAKLQIEAIKMQLDQQEAVLKMLADAAAHDQDMGQDEELHQQDLRQNEESHDQELRLKQAIAAAAASAASRKGENK
jgi:hypothetical protein